MRSACVWLAVPMVAGCGSITAIQLDPADLTAKTNAPEGIVYYLPKPYLLVAQGPAVESEASPTGLGLDLSKLSPERQLKLRDLAKKARDAKTDIGAQVRSMPPAEQNEVLSSILASVKTEPAPEDAGDNQTATVTGDSTTFEVREGQYLAKLVYLPDCSRPMALKITAGILGNINAKPQLQNGWMLTAFAAEVDNTVLLTKLADIIGAVKGTPAPAPAAGDAAGGTTTEAEPLTNGAVTRMLTRTFAPGFYEITCDATQRELRRMRSR